MTAYALTVQCEPRRGIVAAVTTFLAQSGCNITDSAQFDDELTGKFFARITFRSATGKSEAELRDGFADVARKQEMEWSIWPKDHRPKVLLRHAQAPVRGAFRRRHACRPSPRQI